MKIQSGKKTRGNTLLFLLIAILILLVIVSILVLRSGEYDLTGKWLINVDIESGENFPFTLYINSVQPGDTAEQIVSNGCLTSTQGLVMPFEMQAVRNEKGNYSVVIISTARLASSQPQIVRMTGTLQGSLKRPLFVEKGTGAGTLFSQQRQATWTAEFQSNESANCALTITNLPEGIYFFPNMSVHYFYEEYELKEYNINFQIETNIPHSTAWVETPQGITVQLEPNVDIFTPSIDFTNSFRLEKDHKEQPLKDNPYTFSLYNGLGQPLEGTVFEDFWGGCEIGPTHNLEAEFTDDEQEDIEVFWDGIPDGPGWDPGQGIGFYQLLLIDSSTNKMIFGSETQLNKHIIPWEPFGDEAPGFPEGLDYGLSLSELPDGNYHIWINAQVFSTTGISTDCVVRDEEAIINLVKTGETIRYFYSE